MNYNGEPSKNKQERLNCNVGRGVDDWDCYRDCAFWNGKKCTNVET
ncbi:hypothetical protein [Clostridium coskatii]|uniref:Uncharacterized protein n=1 Tax=Clostridium coskatii TaxID=1705578 RepID=A0A162KI82_9CLOT|nr:hypothetical protein [Clostridium coskatii]OAA82812.1 hypothetical protein WX73_03893 [Clostridium coskatii]OBR94171.1 hypothetical protein CLCOS_20370 [Clostridium coskatii]